MAVGCTEAGRSIETAAWLRPPRLPPRGRGLDQAPRAARAASARPQLKSPGTTPRPDLPPLTSAQRTRRRRDARLRRRGRPPSPRPLCSTAGILQPGKGPEAPRDRDLLWPPSFGRGVTTIGRRVARIAYKWRGWRRGSGAGRVSRSPVKRTVRPGDRAPGEEVRRRYFAAGGRLAVAGPRRRRQRVGGLDDVSVRSIVGSAPLPLSVALNTCGPASPCDLLEPGGQPARECS